VPDLALEWLPREQRADLKRGVDDLVNETGLTTAVLISFFLDRRAEPDDELPADDGDRRGFWADKYAEREGDLIGSRAWLLERSADRAGNAKKLEEYHREALAWMLEDGVVSRVELKYEAAPQVLLAAVDLYRTGGTPISLRFAWAWEDLGL